MIIKRLFLYGQNENYIVPFNEGLNIIYGDSDKGKTTILELIKYFLGGDEIQLGEEIKTKVIRCFLEIEVNGKLITIERDIFNKTSLIKVCEENVENILINNVKKYKFYTLEDDGKFKKFSDFLLELLNFPTGKIRKGGRKDSQLQTITFRSLWKYCYLNQDEIGSKKLLNLDNSIVSAINIQILRYIYKILDMDIEELQAEKQGVVLLKNSKELEYKTISEFLKNLEIESLELIKNKIKKLEEELNINLYKKKEIDQEILKNMEITKEFREKLKEEYGIEKEIAQNLEKIKIEQEEFYLLINEYKKELEKIEIAIKLGNSLEYLPKELIIDCKCPVCDKRLDISDIKEKFEVENNEFLIAERKRIKSKHKNLEIYIKNNDLKIDRYIKNKIENEQTIKKLENLLNHTSEKFISPYVSTRDFFIETLGKIREEINSYRRIEKIKENENQVKIEKEELENQILELIKKIEVKQNENVSEEEIQTSLILKITKILEGIKLNNLHDVGINSKFLPKFRGIAYEKHTSGGVRTILSFALYLSILEDTYLRNLNKPPILLLDTIGKYLGKNSEENKEELEDLISDPKKYKKMYYEILRVCKDAKLKGKQVQVIVVDNDYPGEDLEEFIIKKYGNISKKGYENGLINNYYKK